jgi:hypothetical protein
VMKPVDHSAALHFQSVENFSRTWNQLDVLGRATLPDLKLDGFGIHVADV